MSKTRILPIIAFGDPVLKKVAEDIDTDYPELGQLIDNMFETMYNASGLGLAAPQIGLSIRLFIVDASPFSEDHPELDGFVKVFINPIILEESGKKWDFNEGCLSIPDIREDVTRQSKILIEYYDENWDLQEKEFDGMAARVIQHEYDHIEGILFTDHLPALKRRMLKGRLKDITIGNIDVKYRMKYPK
ncbi:MAG: peptide deformylase [Bacteroidia bacterium]|jgi:peptide deformylase